MSKRFSVLWSAAAPVFAVLAASVLTAGPVRAQAPAPDSLGQKPQAQPAAAATTAGPKKASKPPRPPEKSLAEQRAADGPWAKRTNWLSLRAGYAKATGEFAGDGLAGYGIAYQRMLSTRWGFGGSVQHDAVGHLGAATEISVPFTLELTRHFKWRTAMRPYMGFGAGYYFQKFYRTGSNYTGSPHDGMYVSFGTNLPVDERHLLGLDARVSVVEQTEHSVNPVFGVAKGSQTLWSVKLNWALAY